MVLRKLAVANLLAHRTRTCLTAAAIALSVSLVVAVTSGYASLEGAAYRFFTQYLGNTDAILSPGTYGAQVPASLVDALMADSRVKQATGRFETESGLGAGPGKVAEVIGVRRPQDTQVEQLRLESGKWFDTSDGNAAVIDQAMAAQQELKIGDEFTLPGLGDEKLKLKVVGVVHKPEVLAQFRPTLYVPIHTLQTFKKYGDNVTRISIELKDSKQSEQFGADWDQKLKTLAPSVKLRMSGQSRQMLAQNLQLVHLLSYMGGLISMAAAMFIVFSSLSMGVTERQRTLAMLRAIGAFRGQVAWLVVIEGLMIAIFGALVGVVLGVTWIKLLVWKFPILFSAGAIVSPGGVAFGTLGSIGAALAASILPAWSAARVTPLEAMVPMAKVGAERTKWICAGAGAFLIAIDPLVLHGPTETVIGWLGAAVPHNTARVFKFYEHFALGLPIGILGFFLIAPLFVWIFERVMGPVVAAVMGLRFALLRQQLSSGLWRAAGTCTAMMIGLAALIVLQTEGKTAIGGWKLPDKFPDIFIVDFTGIELGDAKKLEDVPGIKKGEVMPVAVVSPGLPNNYLGLAGIMVMPDRTMFIGVDPNKAFKMMELDFREGNAKDAERMLKLGRHVLVTTEFKQLKNLGLGDKLPLKTDHGMVDYTIAGVVWSPGIDVIVTIFDMSRQMDQRTAASVFGSIEDAQRDFGVKRFLLFAANLEYFTEKDTVLKDVQKTLRAQGMRAGDVRQIKARITETFGNMLLLVSTVAFAAMAVSALGVTNTVMASIRTRRYQFGILRSIGVTRMQLLRMVLAEAILLGAVACTLGILAGLELSYNAEVMVVNITGYHPPLVIPWNYVWLGGGLVLMVSILASLWPAAWVARAQPLELLQAGRAAT
ncbi:MAG TPA: FtsX-like permease family protein [Tepidisphaeraceae bacterium]|jgi:putative ABC transport system permease protein